VRRLFLFFEIIFGKLQTLKYSAADERKLMVELWDPVRADDLLKFVTFVYPWGKKNTPLEHFPGGPRRWQREVMQDITDHVQRQKKRGDLALPFEAFKAAVAAGRGIGKSALLGMIAHWIASTRIGSTTLISANTEPQLRLTTFPEIKKWFKMAINAHWFEDTALSIGPAPWFAKQIEKQWNTDTSYYHVQAKLWQEENPDAYAGPHSQIGMLLLFDESSGIPVSIANVANYYFTDVKNPCRLWIAFSNPRHNSGFFYDCFHKTDEKGNRIWTNTRQIDARTVEDSDQKFIADKIAEDGIDSDTVRIEILGQFPNAGTNQFIANATVHEAQTRVLTPDNGAPLIMGVDIARFGDDSSVARFRQGRDARSIPAVKWKKSDNVASADKVAWLIDTFKPDGVFIDQGEGTGVIDILRSRKYRIHEVAFGGTQGVSPEWANKRTEMYAKVRQWLPGGCIDADPLLFGDLTAPTYDFHGKAKDKIILEPKEGMKSRLRRSPDDGDALALTFAGNVARRDAGTSRYASRNRQASDVDYPLFG
jgi:hypothetical protein